MAKNKDIKKLKKQLKQEVKALRKEMREQVRNTEKQFSNLDALLTEFNEKLTAALTIRKKSENGVHKKVELKKKVAESPIAG